MFRPAVGPKGVMRTNLGAEGISGQLIFADFFRREARKKSFGKNSDSPDKASLLTCSGTLNHYSADVR
ncbi:hypothetical protein EDE11_1296 [Methylomonas methanica]|uniref:Uncharacterized protein n=1 Tax=Methylomonas methanica TaxID=421 RepID=A0ABY2CKG2_METMH|nr:hypothetical protein EDE11_1296 [Methylomonas methanica]